jgi:hypothetical protein
MEKPDCCGLSISEELKKHHEVDYETAVLMIKLGDK